MYLGGPVLLTEERVHQDVAYYQLLAGALVLVLLAPAVPGLPGVELGLLSNNLIIVGLIFLDNCFPINIYNRKLNTYLLNLNTKLVFELP